MIVTKRVLVTGGAGLIGSHLCKHLVEQGHHVFCMDTQNPNESSAIRKIADARNFNYLRHNVITPFSLHVDQIYHLATPSTIKYSPAIYVDTFKVNVVGAINCLENARTCRADVLFASSGSVYGGARHAILSESLGYGLSGNNPMAESKRATEGLFRSYKSDYIIETKIARIFNTYGTGCYIEDQHVVPKMIIAALQNRDVTVYGNGEQLRTFCWVCDVVDGLVRLMDLPPDRRSVTVNLGSTHEISIRELAEKIISLCGSRSRIIHTAPHTDDPRNMMPDITLARKLLDWQASTMLEEGLKRTIAYFETELSANKSWVEIY